MKKYIFLLFLFNLSFIHLQGQIYNQNLYIDSTNQIFVKANAPIFFFISSQADTSNKIMLPSSDKLANPMYFDGDGRHYLVYQNKGEKVRYLIFADGVPPKPKIQVKSGLLFMHKNRIYAKENALFVSYAYDKRSGTRQIFYSINNLPFVENNKGFSIETPGEHSVRVYATDNVGNVSDTTTFSIISSPDVTFKANNIYFATASARILPESIDNLNEILDILKNYPEIYIEIDAHADTRGNSVYNMTLSEKRAYSVASYFIEKGIASFRIKSKGFGDTKPVNECLKGVVCPDSKHKENRRVEFRFFLPKH